MGLNVDQDYYTLQAFAAAFAEADAKAIVLVAKKISSLVEVEKEIGAINSKVQVLKTQADITDLVAVEEVYRSVKETFGTAHVLINNAGVLTSPKPLSDAAIEDWWKGWVSGAHVISKLETFI